MNVTRRSFIGKVAATAAWGLLPGIPAFAARLLPAAIQIGIDRFDIEEPGKLLDKLGGGTAFRNLSRCHQYPVISASRLA